MAHRVCPAWVGHLLACPLRRLIHDPEALLRAHVSEGMTVLEIGPGMGYFTVPMARMVGPAGKVIAVDVQPKMLEGLRRRASKAGVAERVITRLCAAGDSGVEDLAGQVDFMLAFAVVHEVPDARKLFADVQRAMKPGASCLVAEPRGHVPEGEFEQSLAAAAAAGLDVISRPAIARSHAALLRKAAGASAAGTTAAGGSQPI